jgi:Asp-tRNA(Asn)/Glu-tRNA(Gln) amidotransferase A subunit family amidase
MTDRLPIGIQLVGPYFSDGVLLRIGYTFEQTADWNHGVGPEAWHPESGRDSQVSDEA